ncbi:MAG: PepSY domain-containing protein [Anaerolineales bacterium]
MQKRSEVLVLFGFGLILVVALLVLWVTLSGGSSLLPVQRPTAEWRGTAPKMPLELAVQYGALRAREWTSDAQLIWVKGSWRPTAEALEEEHPAIAWSLYYYSPSKRETASVTVRGEETFWVPPRPVEATPSPLAPFPPPQGIEVAWISFRAAGGDTFLAAHPDALVQYRLQRSDERLVWAVLALDAGESLEVKVDALTGQVIPSHDS